jgi:hypothetical protein
VLLLSCAAPAPLAPLPSFPVPPAPPAAPSPPLASAPAATLRPAPAATPAPKDPPGWLPAVSLGDIGSGGAVQLLGASSSGAWVALCDGQPRRPRLVLGSGPGEPIDELLAQDPRGRYVVVGTAGVAELVDAVTSSRLNLTELGADVRRLRSDYAEHRALSFDDSGKYLAYVRRQGAGPQLVVRDLEAGTERVFTPGAGDVLRIQLSADARYLTFDALREDTNHNGKLDWPAPEEPPGKSACGKPPLRFRSFAYQSRGDAPQRGVVALANGAVRDVPELLTPLGDALLVRAPDASLQLEQGGKRAPLAPASCAGRVLFADAERGLVVAACTPPPPKKQKGRSLPPPTGKREVWLFGAGVALNLQRELYETAVDRESVVGTRLVPLYPGSEAGLLDLERRELLPLTPGSRVLATNGPLALVWRENDLYQYDALARQEARLARGVAKNPDLLRAGNSVLLSPFVVLAASGPALLSPEHPLALTVNGFVLTGSSDGAGAAGAIQGPLHWVDARLPPPDGPPR